MEYLSKKSGRKKKKNSLFFFFLADSSLTGRSGAFCPPEETLTTAYFIWNTRIEGIQRLCTILIVVKCENEKIQNCDGEMTPFKDFEEKCTCKPLGKEKKEEPVGQPKQNTK